MVVLILILGMTIKGKATEGQCFWSKNKIEGTPILKLAMIIAQNNCPKNQNSSKICRKKIVKKFRQKNLREKHYLFHWSISIHLIVFFKTCKCYFAVILVVPSA